MRTSSPQRQKHMVYRSANTNSFSLLQTRLYFILPGQHLDPVHLLFRRNIPVCLETLRHIIDKLTLIRRDTWAISRNTIEEGLEFLYLLPQCRHFCGGEGIARFWLHRGLPRAISCNVPVPSSNTCKLVGAFILLVAHMPANPLKSGRNYTLTEEGTIHCPQIRVGLHLVDALGNIDNIFTVAVDSQRQIGWSNGQYSEYSRDLNTIVRCCLGAGNISRTFDASCIIAQFSVDKIEGTP